MIIANAVINHQTQPHKARVQRRIPSHAPRTSSCSLAKLTTRIEFAVATPMHMMAPVSAGTLNRVLVKNRNHAIPASAAGSAGR